MLPVLPGSEPQLQAHMRIIMTVSLSEGSCVGSLTVAVAQCKPYVQATAQAPEPNQRLKKWARPVASSREC